MDLLQRHSYHTTKGSKALGPTDTDGPRAHHNKLLCYIKWTPLTIWANWSVLTRTWSVKKFKINSFVWKPSLFMRIL